MIVFTSLDHVCDPRYLKLTNFAFFSSPRLAQNGHFGFFAIAAKVEYAGVLYPMFKSKKMFTGLSQGYIN